MFLYTYRIGFYMYPDNQRPESAGPVLKPRRHGVGIDLFISDDLRIGAKEQATILTWTVFKFPPGICGVIFLRRHIAKRLQLKVASNVIGGGQTYLYGNSFHLKMYALLRTRDTCTD